MREIRQKMAMHKVALAALAAAFLSGGALAQDAPTSAEDKVKQICAACHGADGNQPNTPETPKLGGQHADYLAKALRDYKSGVRKNPIMGAMAAGLSDKEIVDLSRYFARQKGELYVKY